MTRFEIQDIIRQNRDGVTFRALDKSNDQIISLRRFFPFGQCDENEEGGEGLDPAEGKAFSTACERLSQVQHPALRRTIYGDIDPIDGMPYLVTEWIEGESLSVVLGNNAMPADMTIALIQQVFDVCKLLSQTLQSEAIWIDTNPDSIIVCNPTVNPTFNFRICPFKWLGTSKSHLKDMSSIVSLIEAMMGWKSKLVSDQAGKGLGGYIKLLRQYPEMEINKAIQSLPNHSYEVVEVVTETTKTPTTLFPPIPVADASFFNKKSITIMCISAIVTGALIFIFYQQRANQTEQNIIVESEVYDPAKDPGIISNPKIVTPDPEPPTKTPDTTGTDSENKTATNTNVPPIDPTDTAPTDKDPKETEKTAETDKKAPTETVQTDKTLESTTWSPISIPSVVWYDASTASIKDGTVTIANAGSGGGTISGPASLVDNGIGNLQAVQFNGTDQYLTGDLDIKGASLTVFYVGKSSNTTQTEYATMMTIFDKAQTFDWNNEKSAVLFSQNKVIANSIYTHRNTLELSSATGSLTNGFLAGVVFNGSNHTLYLNGASSKSVASTGNLDSNKVIFGARWQSGNIIAPYWNGRFGEVMAFNSELSESDRQKIEGYLAHKWGLTGDLPANHPYKSSAPGPPSSKTETLVNLPTKETPTEKPKTIPQNIRSWSPDEITAAAWYDAADSTTITASSSKVSQWRDKSGNDLHLAQSTAAKQPKTGSQINGLNALDFTLNAMTTAKNPFGSSVSNAFVIAVYKVDSIQDGTLFSLTGSESHTSRWNAQAPFGDKFMYFDCGGVIPGSTRVSVKDYGVIPGNAVLASFYSSATDNLQQVYKNGNLLVGDTSGHAVSTVGNISVGGVTTSYQDATIGEMIIINGTVDEATRQKLEGYLAHKWGTTTSLPANHPYKSSVPIPSILTSSDVGIIKTLEVGDPVTLQGTVKSAKFSSTGKSIYLSFSDPEVETDVRVVIHGNEYDGTAFTEEEFAKLIGKNLVFSGTVYTESFNDRPPFVKITEKAQIKLATKSADKPNTPEKAKARPIFTPDDAEAIAKLELKEPVAVRGVVKSVRIPKPGGGLYFSFSDPFDRKQIQVVTYPSPFEDGPHDATSFKKIEAEFQHLVGKTVTFNGSASRQKDNSFQFVFISKREHIVVEEATDKGTSEVQNQNEKPIEADPLNNVKTGTRIQLKGTLRAVKINNGGNAMVLLFAIPYQPGQLRGVAYKLNYKDEFDIKNFEPFVGKPISIEGLLIIDGNKDKFVEITNLNQISLIEK